MADLVVNVSKEGPVYTIQEAVNILNESIVNNGIDGDLYINIDQGVYSGFTIPDAMLANLIGSAYRLKISASGKFFPVIDFNESSEAQLIGIDLGTANANITIESLWIQYFSVGIRALANCHELKINKCVIINNRNSAIFVEHSENVQILQNVVVNGDYGIVSRLCKNCALIHNTVYNNGSISTDSGKSVSALWCEAGHDYGQGVSDTGRIHLIGNIVFNTAGRAITLFYDDVENGAIVSNYNDITLSPGSDYIALEDRIFYRNAGNSVRRVFRDLQSWKTQTNLDPNSISANPGFVKALKTKGSRNIDGIDLTLISTSSVLGVVPSFYTDSVATSRWLPSYVDSADFSSDILNNPRSTSGTACGCNDRASNSGFYGQDIFTDPLTLDTPDCTKDPLYDLVGNKVQSWYPRIKTGFFYSYDREYYLYSKKKCAMLGELAVTEFILPKEPVLSRPIIVSINGTKIEDPSYLDVIGNRLYVYHKILDIVSLEEEIDIECSIRQWSEDDGFSYSIVIYRFKFNQGTLRYIFPKDYVPSIVSVTDDMASPSDPFQSQNREFTVKVNGSKEEGDVELVFADKTNVICNGQFEYHYGEAPILWESEGCTVTSPTLKPNSAYGDNVCRMSGNSYLEKIVKTVTGESCLSWHARGTGTLDYRLETIDHTYRSMGYYVTGSVSLTSDWTRYYIAMGATGDAKAFLVQDGPYPMSNLGYILSPGGQTNALIKFSRPSGEYIELDAVQYEYSLRPSNYHRRPFLNELTVEYETSDTEWYVDTKQSVSPLRNHISDSFVFIPEVCAGIYGGPNYPSITTLNDIKWSEGRRNIIPWARLGGYDKLRYRPTDQFNLVPEKRVEYIFPALNTAKPKEIRINPTVPQCLQGDKHGVGISIQCTDDDGNPTPNLACAAYLYNDDQRFPGWLFKAKYGLKEQLGQAVVSTLDSSGRMSFLWIPPEEGLGKYVGLVPIPRFSHSYGRRMSVITTKYPVNTVNSGGVVVISESGQELPIYGAIISGDYIPSYSEDNSVVSLPFTIKYGSVVVEADSVKLKESDVSSIESDQFFVNYEESKIYVLGRYESLKISYIPVYYYINKNEPYKIIFDHDKIFGNYDGSITVGYDYKLDLQIQVEVPGYDSYIYRDFELVAQNSLVRAVELTKNILLEI